MEIRFDWPRIYRSVVSRGSAPGKLAGALSRRIERLIREQSVPPGTMIGTVPDICERFAVGRETLLQAVCMLEDRGVARMRRGAHGGLIVLTQPVCDAVPTLERHFRMHGMSGARSHEALAALIVVQDCLDARAAGRSDAFDRAFVARLEAGYLPIDRHAPIRLPDAGFHPALRPFAHALARIRAESGPGRNAGDRLGLGLDTQTRGLVWLVADVLAGELSARAERGERRLGCEVELAERIGVSRQILRQALRLLEGRGMLCCQRGRSRGIVGTVDHPADVIETLIDHYAAADLDTVDIRAVLTMLGRINRILVATRADPHHFRLFERLLSAKRWDDPAARMERMHIEWGLLDNPALSLLEQGLSAFRAQRAGSGTLVVIADPGPMQALIGDHLEALRTGDLAGSDHIYRAMQTEIDRILVDE